jgi:hypothetical protein
LDNKLNKIAQAFAEKLASANNGLQHNANRGRNVGENVYYSRGGNPYSMSGKYTYDCKFLVKNMFHSYFKVQLQYKRGITKSKNLIGQMEISLVLQLDILLKLFGKRQRKWESVLQ